MHSRNAQLAKIRQLCLNQTRTLIQQNQGAASAQAQATTRFANMLFENPIIGKEILIAAKESGVIDHFVDLVGEDSPEYETFELYALPDEEPHLVSVNNAFSKRGVKHLLKDSPISSHMRPIYVEGSAAVAPPKSGGFLHSVVEIVYSCFSYCKKKIINWIMGTPEVVGVFGVMVICCIVGKMDPINALKVALREVASYLGFAPEQREFAASNAVFPSLDLGARVSAFSLPRAFAVGMAAQQFVL